MNIGETANERKTSLDIKKNIKFSQMLFDILLFWFMIEYGVYFLTQFRQQK